MSDEQRVFYFGCIGGPGHYLWLTENQIASTVNRLGLSRSLFHALDGAFCPDGIQSQPQQRWLCSIVPPWTIVAWWDRSGDRRPNSLSALIGRDFGNEPHRLLEAAKLAFPSVFTRQPQPLEEFAA